MLGCFQAPEIEVKLRDACGRFWNNPLERKPPRFRHTGITLQFLSNLLSNFPNRKRIDPGAPIVPQFLETNVIFFQKRAALQNVGLVECPIAELMRRINNIAVSD
jgi:hypothetical protein